MRKRLLHRQGQAEAVEIPASYKPELTSKEQAAVDLIEDKLSQRLTDWDVGRSELQDISRTISGLEPQEKSHKNEDRHCKKEHNQ